MAPFICSKCKAIPANIFRDGSVHNFQTYADLECSARDGCATCTIFLNGFEGQEIEETSRDVKLQYDPKYPSFGNMLCGRTYGRFSCFIKKRKALDLRKTTERLLSGKLYLASAADCEENVLLIRDLIDNCLRNHSDCRVDMAQGSPPTRLLDLGVDTVDGKLRIVPGTDCCKKDGQYLALSHCWGNVPQNAPWKLTQERLADYSSHIPIDVLPLTFRQAIRITAKLGERYLWIDSLCIIQDSPSDWAFEAKRMADVYTRALCTLSAASNSANGGCVIPRDMSKLQPVTLKLYAPWVKSYRSVIVNPCLPADDNAMNDTPVSKRAWCFQERDLSLRMIQFTSHQFTFFCKTVFTNEADLYPVLSGLSTDVRREVIKGLGWEMRAYGRNSRLFNSLTHSRKDADERKPRLSSLPYRETCDDWYDTVREFSRRSITYPSDRLPAIEGLANRCKHRISGGYAAGLWEVDIVRGVLWVAKETVLQRPSPAIAPSWSWACLNAPIAYERGALHNRDDSSWEGKEAEWQAVKISIEGVESDRDIVTAQLLRVNGQLLAVKRCGKVHYDDSVMKAHLRVQSIEDVDEEQSVIGEVVFDAQNDVQEGGQLVCLLVHRIHENYYNEPEGLALKCISEAKAEYVRVGFVKHVKSEAFKGVGSTNFSIV